MSSDLDLLAILGERDKYERYYEHVKGNFLTSEGEDIGKHIAQYFDQDVLKSTKELDWNNFGSWYLLKNPMLSFEKKDNMKKIFDGLTSYSGGDEVFTKNILGELTTMHYASEIGRKAMSIADGSAKDDLEDIQTMLDQATDDLADLDDGADPTHLDLNDIEWLFGEDEDHPVLEFSLAGLRAAFKGITKGNLVVVGAHPDTGKTTFLCGELAHMLPQIPKDHHILYFNNEQSGKDLAYRVRSACLGVPVEQMFKDPVKSAADYKALGGDRIQFFDKSFMSTKYINERVKRYEGKIGLILIDQLWKVRGASKSSNDFMQFAHTFAWARDLCKQHAPLITVHQSDAAGYDKKYLTMENLFGSNIAIQGEADAIVMIGRMTDGSQRPDVRHMNVPKNKLPKGTNPMERNNKFDVFIDHDMVRYRDVV